MKTVETKFGSLDSFHKGNIDIFKGSKEDYAFSNLFEVAKDSSNFERIAIAKNFEYVIEVMKIEGQSSWYQCRDDEFCIIMSGKVEASFIMSESIKVSDKYGAVILDKKPKGPLMGRVIATQGHMVMLPRDRAYCLSSSHPSVIIIQTLLSENTVEKWRDICRIK